ncbi:MAG: thioredoxin family protein [Burkholderiales bacterium]|nr:thioredoxin family protein [Burkholderiales bacterium]
MNPIADTENLDHLRTRLSRSPWLVACLCAAWCDICKNYRASFDALAARHPDKCFAWIDIEDQAQLVDEIDIENFPTILIQHQDSVAFLGTMLPDTGQLQRLLVSIEESAAAGAIRRSSLNQDAPQGWSLRRLILARHD